MKNNHRTYFISYTILFVLILAVISSWLLLTGRSLVLGGDPVAQHVRALIYYGRWLRELPGYIVRERALPTYALSIGYGSDVITTLHFYVIGDPLNLFCAFVPTAYMAVFYSVMIIVRMYLAGACFSFMCFSLNAGQKARPAGIMAGTLTYVFSAYTIFGGWRHPFFLNPMIYFPLIIAGAERIRTQKRHLLFALSVAVSAMSNFYFFYMIVAVTIVYALWRCVCVYGKEIRRSARFIAHLAGASLVGVLTAGIILVPVLYAFAGNPRSVEGYLFDALYTSDYYLRFPASLITFWSAGEWGYIGISSVALLTILTLFVRRRRRDLQVLFLIGAAALLIPAAGYAMNGFSYVSSRWVWAFVFLCAYMVTQGWDELFHSWRLWQISVPVLAGIGLLGLSGSRAYEQIRLNLWIQLGLLAAAVIIVCFANGGRDGDPERSGKGRPAAMAAPFVFSLMILGICCNGLFGIIPSLGGVGNGYYQWNRVAGDTAEIFDTESAAIRRIEGAYEFYRYSGRDLSGNASVQDGVPSTQFYWSLANGYVFRFFEKMGLCVSYANAYATLDDRTILNEIAAVRDFYSQKEKHVPWGYERLGTEENPEAEKYPIYRNGYALPFGITYHRVMGENAFDALDPGAGQEILLTDAVIPDDDLEKTVSGSGLEIDDAPDTELTRVLPAFSMEPVKEKAVIDGNTITAIEDGARIRIRFEGTQESESYLYLGKIDFRDEDGSYSHIPERLQFKLSSYAGKEKLASRTLTWFTRREKWYAGRNSFLIPGGYHGEKLSSFILTLPVKGVYTFDEISVCTQPLGETYVDRAGMLKEEVPDSVDLHTGSDTLTWATGKTDLSLSCSSDSLLCLQMAYSKGWKARVDGEAVPLIRTDLMFTGLALSAGDHSISLRYTTPGLAVGACMTLAGMVILIIYVCRRKSGRK